MDSISVVEVRVVCLSCRGSVLTVELALAAEVAVLAAERVRVTFISFLLGSTQSQRERKQVY